MVQMHKHKGLVRKDTGALRNHPVTQKHKDTKVQIEHDRKIGTPVTRKTPVENKLKDIKKVSIHRSVLCPVDSEGYINIDLSELIKQKGIRLKFERKEGNTKKIVGLQVEK